MNKTELINVLTEQLPYSEAQCEMINSVFENNFFISKSSKDTIVHELAQNLEVDQAEAEKIYEVAIGIITKEVKNKLRHPFRNQD